MTLIVDASVAVAWYLPESLSEKAEQVLSREAALIAPELILAEIGNAVWRRVRKREIPPEGAVHIIERATAAFTALISLTQLAPHAMHLSSLLDRPIYDCFYIALAIESKAPLVTADRALSALAGAAGFKAELLS